jgi:AcrR family transcriptional regulator
MARVADELGVTAAAIYYHVPDKAGMIDLAVDAILTDLVTPGAEFGTWDERLRRWADDFFTLVSEHRGLGPQLARNPKGTTALRLASLCVELLCEAGMTPAEAIRAQAPLRWYVMGEFADQLQNDRTARRFEVVPDIETAFPDLAELAVHLDALDQREVLLHGIDLFIAGFKAQIAAKQSDRATA